MRDIRDRRQLAAPGIPPVASDSVTPRHGEPGNLLLMPASASGGPPDVPAARLVERVRKAIARTSGGGVAGGDRDGGGVWAVHRPASPPPSARAGQCPPWLTPTTGSCRPMSCNTSSVRDPAWTRSTTGCTWCRTCSPTGGATLGTARGPRHRRVDVGPPVHRHPTRFDQPVFPDPAQVRSLIDVETARVIAAHASVVLTPTPHRACGAWTHETSSGRPKAS